LHGIRRQASTDSSRQQDESHRQKGEEHPS
jgi:hypothetical protein